MSHTHDAAHELPVTCPNCDAPVHGPFCAQCGQETVHEMPTLREFAHQYLHHYIAAEGKLLPTVKLLLLKPGQLTLEYLEGRRRRYVMPLPLYVTFSFLFFLLLSWSGAVTHPHLVYIDNQPAAHPTQAISALAASESDPTGKQVLDFTARVASALDQPDKVAEFTEHLLHRLPYAVFVLMPVFASMCALVYRRRRQHYGMHLLFTVHLHAFIFAVFLMCLIPGVSAYAAWSAFLILAYLIVALKRVYGGRWWPQVARGILLGACYAVISSLALAVVTFLSSGIQLRLS
jgi:hypothetical protein